MFENPFLRRRLKYRDKRRIDESEVADVFDGTHFQQLREKNVKWQGTVHRPEHKYFDASTDIALGFSTDGVPLHNRTGLDAWPLVLTIFSLPPEIRYKQEFQLCCGLVPGDYGGDLAPSGVNANRQFLLRYKIRQRRIGQLRLLSRSVVGGTQTVGHRGRSSISICGGL
jgi:hypothetical protein